MAQHRFRDRSPTSCAILLLTLVLLHGFPAAAQSLSSGSVVVRVTGAGAAPVGGALVELTQGASGVTHSATVGRDGIARFPGLRPGDYLARAEQVGFLPHIVDGITVRPGAEANVEVALTRIEGPAERVDTTRYEGGLLAGSAAGRTVDVGATRLMRYPLASRRIPDLLGFSTAAGADLSIEGLSGALTGLRIDGIPVGVLDGQALTAGVSRDAALPLTMFGHAAVVAGNPDVEWSGHAGGSIDLYTAVGGARTGLEGFGRWSGAGLISSSGDHPQTIDQLYEVGLLWSGAVVPDSAHATLGFEAIRRSGNSLLGGVGLPDDIHRVARDVYGIGDADSRTVDVISGFGALAWAISPTTKVEARSNFGVVTSGGPEFFAGSGPAAGVRSHDGADVQFGATITSRFSETAFQEARIAIDRGARSYSGADAFGQTGPTWIGVGGAPLGPAATSLSEFSRWNVRASETLHLLRGAHQIKFGVAGTVGSVSAERGRTSTFYVADAGAFEAGTGYHIVTEPGTPGASFTTLSGALFAQDSWTAGTGFDVLVGLRFDVERLPGSRSVPNQAWFAASGLDDSRAPSGWWRMSPRVGFTWDVQDRHEWLLTGSAGIYSGSADPVVLAEWLADDGSTRIGRGFGSLTGWPAPPNGSSGTVAPSLTLIHPDFEAPRTTRADFGISRAIGTSTAIHLAAAYRHTDFLPRALDLNLAWFLPVGFAVDGQTVPQHGRRIHGNLRMEGGLLFPEAGSNRRFREFDRVTAILVDGWSTYRGLTATVEHRPGPDLDLFASYTLSRTTDNLVGIGGPVTLASTGANVEAGGASDWSEGRSDLDATHRAAAGLEFALPGLPARIAMLYRFASGRPFTPGFASGVDADGNGVFGDDPAFIDTSVPGAADVIGGWACLSDDAGRFATRNGCRGPASHTLDARIGIAVLRIGNSTGEITLEGLNLLGTDRSYVDPALYRVDGSGELVQSGFGSVEVPLVANEGFGREIETNQPGRIFRVGLQLGF